MTEYVVLQKLQSDSAAVYEIVGQIAAPGGNAAIRKIVENGAGNGAFVAVPARSFQLVSVKLEDRPRARITGSA